MYAHIMDCEEAEVAERGEELPFPPPS